jgi:hypothetical protein
MCHINGSLIRQSLLTPNKPRAMPRRFMAQRLIHGGALRLEV